jgi:hypothetical protein
MSKAKDVGSGIKEVKRTTKWLVCGSSPKKVEDLPFVGSVGSSSYWWTVTPPKTDYEGVHRKLGRAYAFDLLDLVHSPDAEIPEHIIGCIAEAMMRWSRTVEPCAGEAIPHGFFEVLSEYLVTGRVNR